MGKQLLIFAALAQLAGGAIFSEVPTLSDSDIPELSLKNRFSARALFLESIAGAGLEYERAIGILDYAKASIATSVNTAYRAKSDSLKPVSTTEFSSFADVTLRATFMPIRYAQFFAGGGATLYSTTVKLSDSPAANRAAEGSASFGGMAIIAEFGVRLTFGAFSIGCNLSATRFPGQDINYTYQSGNLQYRDTLYYRPLANERLNIFAGFLF